MRVTSDTLLRPSPSRQAGAAAGIMPVGRRSDLDSSRDPERLRRERNLYLRLLGLSAQTEVEPFLKEALTLVVEVSGARNGYLELHEPRGRADGPGWSIAHGFSEGEAADVRSRVSQGIIAQTLASGESIDTPSALLDPRFSERASVRARRIEAVLCVPIGADPPLGVLYLQGRNEPGPFDPIARESAETFAHHVARLAEHLLVRIRGLQSPDPTQPYRESLNVSGLVGRSPALAGLLRDVALVSPLDVSVLLTGESGTGKSHVARLIHDNGPRASQPFVELNCGAIPDGLVESELFGALAGSHSTANRALTGKVQAAERGTLFLDEVGELSAAAQVKLLQLLQSGVFYPLGASEPSRADVRIIAATNTDLQATVADGSFREDLYYRLHVLPLRVPSLAERREDVLELATHFCQQASERHRLPRLGLSISAMRALENAEWPGHVRQLEHAIEAAVIRAAGAGAANIEVSHLFPEAPAVGPDDEPDTSFQEATRRFQAELLRSTLESTGWNVSEAARQLDLARSHVYNLIRAFGLERG
jgi:transcriptional regulator with GAF, ATPase, and Fis domain